MIADFGSESAKIGLPHLCSVRWNSTTGGRIATRIRQVHTSNNVEATDNFVACCFDNVAQNCNNVESTFDFVEATFDFIAFDSVASTLLLV